MNAAPAYATLGYVGRQSCFGIIPRFGRQARPGELGDLRPGGLSPLGIRDTGQNTSPVQDAFRSLHYVAVTCLPSLACSATISLPMLNFFGDRPLVAWGQTLKSVLKTIHYPNIPRSYRLNDKNENSMRNILGLILLRLKKYDLLA